MDHRVEQALARWLIDLVPDIQMDAEIIRQNRDSLISISQQPSWTQNAAALPKWPTPLRQLIHWLEELLLELPMDRDRIHTLHDQLIEISQRLYQQELAAGLVEEQFVPEPVLPDSTT